MNTPTIDDQAAAIEAVIQLLPEGWNKRNAELFASAFTDPHDYVAAGGRLMQAQTRAANAQAHEWLWQTRFAEGSTIHFESLSIDFPLPNLALALVKHHNDFIVEGQPLRLESIITLVLLKIDQGWCIRQFNNNLVQD
jgi:uncharacterized protein (TIGR02246 family)